MVKTILLVVETIIVLLAIINHVMNRRNLNENCLFCFGSELCTGCIFCFKCSCCKNCRFCIKCDNCEACDWCKQCLACVRLKLCKLCRGCINCESCKSYCMKTNLHREKLCNKKWAEGSHFRGPSFYLNCNIKNIVTNNYKFVIF